MSERKIPVRVLLANENLPVRAGMRRVLEHSGDFEVVAEAGDDAKDKGILARVANGRQVTWQPGER